MKSLAVALIGALLSFGAHAQQWPAKPIKMVVPFTAGGSTDTVARSLRGVGSSAH